MSREAFEAAYAAHMNESLEDDETPHAAADIAKLRDGDWYGLRRSYLNGCWKGWQMARAAALEEAAEVADSHATCEGIGQRIAAEIRALKEKE